MELTLEQKKQYADRNIGDIIRFHTTLAEMVEEKPTLQNLGAIASQFLCELKPHVEDMPAEAQSYFNFLGCLADALVMTKSNDPELICGIVIDRLHLVRAMQREAYREWCKKKQIEPAEL